MLLVRLNLWHNSVMDDELWDDKRVGKELGIAPDSARKEMSRAGIKKVRISGFPANYVRRYMATKRWGRGRTTPPTTKDED